MIHQDAIEFYLPASLEWADRYSGEQVLVEIYHDQVFDWIVVHVCGSNGHTGVLGRLELPPDRVEEVARAVRSIPLPLSVADFAAMGFEVAEWHWRQTVPPGRPDPRCQDGLLAFLQDGHESQD